MAQESSSKQPFWERVQVRERESQIGMNRRNASDGLNIKDQILRKMSPNVEFVLQKCNRRSDYS